MQARAELQQLLLALRRVAGETRWFSEGARVVDVAAAVAGRVSGVEQVEDLGDDLDPDAAPDREVLGDREVHLLERVSAPGVDARRTGRQVDAEARRRWGPPVVADHLNGVAELIPERTELR